MLEPLSMIGLAAAVLAVAIWLVARHRPDWLYRRPTVPLERLNGLLAQLDVDDSAEIRRLLDNGHRIAAISTVRKRTGATLPEAIVVVDRMERG